jgi:heme-degrading monooxygenase HmoA
MTRRRTRMAKIGQPYTQGTWVVQPGNEAAFIDRWTEFTEWSLANAAGAQSFLLLRDAEDERRFISVGAWEDMDTVNAWRATPAFAERLAACRELCEEFRATDHRLSAAVGA